MDKYRKSTQTSRKTAIYVAIIICVAALNIVSLVEVFSCDEGTYTAFQMFAVIVSTSISFISLLYCVVQDLLRARRAVEVQFHYEEGDIPFVDREELLKEILTEISGKMETGGSFCTKNIRYSHHNGKRSFSGRLCHELQQIKNRKGKNKYGFSPKMASKIGNIFLVKYANDQETFEGEVKARHTYIRGRKNIVVVVSSSEDPPSYSDRLKDKDIFFVFLNFNTHSDNDALFFPDDKIVLLLEKLQSIPAYAPLLKSKSADDLAIMAQKLGSISQNNIGTIVDLLNSNDFTLLVETDRAFVDFYVALRHGHYKEAEKKYLALPKPAPDNLVLRYKQKYEYANLRHFLGAYEDAYTLLEELYAMMSLDREFAGRPLGRSLYFDTVILQSHIRKHQGRFDDAATLLDNVEEEQKNLTWKRAHFAANIFQLNERDPNSAWWKNLLNLLTQMMADFKDEREIENSEFFFYEAYYPIVSFYNSGFCRKKIPELIQIEERAIYYYEREERRFVTNCYFIKAELLRLMQRWDEAAEFYNRCYDIYCHNGDKDIYYLLAIAYTCIRKFEYPSLKAPFDCDAAIEECKQQEENYRFHRRLISQMELAVKDAKARRNWIVRYRTTINPIP